MDIVELEHGRGDQLVALTVGEGDPILAILPHYVVARLLGPDPDEERDAAEC